MWPKCLNMQNVQGYALSETEKYPFQNASKDN